MVHMLLYNRISVFKSAERFIDAIVEISQPGAYATISLLNSLQSEFNKSIDLIDVTTLLVMVQPFLGALIVVPD